MRVFGLSSLEDLPQTELSPTEAPTPEAMAVEEVGFTAGAASIPVAENSSTDEEKGE